MILGDSPRRKARKCSALRADRCLRLRDSAFLLNIRLFAGLHVINWVSIPVNIVMSQ